MAKKRKTRLQKISSTHRHSESTVTYSLSSLEKPLAVSEKPLSIAKPAHSKQQHTFEFVQHDLIRTTTITGAIIVAELALFFVLR